jgi:hypothetical protein
MEILIQELEYKNTYIEGMENLKERVRDYKNLIQEEN